MVRNQLSSPLVPAGMSAKTNKYPQEVEPYGQEPMASCGGG